MGKGSGDENRQAVGLGEASKVDMRNWLVELDAEGTLSGPVLNGPISSTITFRTNACDAAEARAIAQTQVVDGPLRAVAEQKAGRKLLGPDVSDTHSYQLETVTVSDAVEA